MARLRCASAALTWLLSGCVFIDDFERFREAPRRDGGPSDDAAPAPDAAPEDGGSAGGDAARDDTAITEPERDAGREDDAGSAADAAAGDAQSGAPDAEAGPRDAGSQPTDARVPPADTGTPAPGCASASIPTLRCYPDRDGDRFADLTQPFVLACSCPAGTLPIANPAQAQGDCWDDPNTRGADVFPGQEAYFQVGYGIAAASFDYDCDDAETKRFGVLERACNGLLGLLCTMGKGYTRETACGRPGEYTVCGPVGLNCGVASQMLEVQPCR